MQSTLVNPHKSDQSIERVVRIIKTIKNALICKYIPNFKLPGSLRPYKHEYDFCALQGRFDGNSTVLLHIGLNYASANSLCALAWTASFSREFVEKAKREQLPLTHFVLALAPTFAQ